MDKSGDHARQLSTTVLLLAWEAEDGDVSGASGRYEHNKLIVESNREETPISKKSNSVTELCRSPELSPPSFLGFMPRG